MSSIVLVDTSVYLNVLDVPGWNQDRAPVLDEFGVRVHAGDYFVLPMATVWETGNHISDLANGQLRRKFAKKLFDDVSNAMNGKTPYRATYFPSKDEFLTWLGEFPEYAMRNKSPKKEREGVSLADLSIIKEWERTCRTSSMSTVLIWSLDSDLAGYSRQGR